MARKKIGALLEEKGHITEFQLVAALSHQRKWKSKLGQSLIELGYLEENQLYEVLAEQLGMEFVDPRKLKIPPEVMKYASKELARDWYSVPVGFDGQTWTVVTSDPQKPGLANKLALYLKGQVKLVLATTLAIENLARKIADKVPVATVQPVKRAFVKDENGAFTPFKPTPAESKPQSDDDLFLAGTAAGQNAGPDKIEIPLEEYAAPSPSVAAPPQAAPAAPGQDEIINPPAEPDFDAAFMDEAPALEIPAPSAPEPGPESAAVELPPDELMEIEHEREPDLSEPPPLTELDEIPLEAAHESAASIPVEEAKEATDMIDLDELLPPPVADEPAPDGEMTAPELGAEGPPSLMETATEPGPAVEAPPLLETPLESAEAGLEAPLEAPPLEEAAMEMQDQSAAGPPDRETSLPDLGAPPLGAPPAFDSAGEDSLEVPSLDSVLAGVTGKDAGPLFEPPSAMKAQGAASLEAPPLDIPSVSTEPGQAASAGAAKEGPEEIETLEESVTEEVTDEAVPAEPGPVPDEENTREIMDKISLLEQQIKGMTDMLSGFKDTLKEKKGKPKDKK